VTPGKSKPPSRRRNPRRLSAASHFVTTLLAVGPVGCHSSQGVTSPSPLASQTYYVSKDGSDSRSCAQAQSMATPKQTIAGGLACLTAAGDTLLIRAGTYNEAIIQTQFVSLIPSGTSWSNKVRVAAYPGETVWMAPIGSQSVVWLIVGSYIEFDGINMDGTNVLGAAFATGEAAHHIRIQNAEIIRGTAPGGGESDGVMFGAHYVVGAIGSNEAINLRVHGGDEALGYGIYLSGPNNLVDSCDIYDTSSAGVHIYNGGGDSADNNIVRNSRIHDIRRSPNGVIWGILVSGNGSQILNNTVYNIGRGDTMGAGIDIYSGQRNVVENNTVSRSQPVGIYVESGAADTVLRRNMSSDNTMDYLDRGANTSNVR
jgi:parallel beta-helix repeat protein